MGMVEVRGGDQGEKMDEAVAHHGGLPECRPQDVLDFHKMALSEVVWHCGQKGAVGGIGGGRWKP